jgi:hypothetical protein
VYTPNFVDVVPGLMARTRSFSLLNLHLSGAIECIAFPRRKACDPGNLRRKIILIVGLAFTIP